MVDIQISVSVKGNSPEPSGIVTVRKYGDPIMVNLMGLDTNYLGTSNFQNVSLFTRSNGFGAVSQFQELNKSALDYLISIQPTDAGTLNSKMSFLMNGTRGRPYWTRNGTWNNWGTATRLLFGTIVFGGQKCLVETDQSGVKKEYIFWGKYQQVDHYENIVFYKLKGLPWSQHMNYNPIDHPYYIQRGTWATWQTNPNNQYRDTWHEGIVYHPVWDAQDFPVNYGDRELFLAKEFCV